MTLRPNKFAGKCQCGRWVEAGAGFITKTDEGKWQAVCQPCSTGEAVETSAPVAAPAYDLTEEQQHAVELFSQGLSLAIEAGAGAGKSSTLFAIAKSTARIGTYIAYNAAIVNEAAAKAPPNLNCATGHSLAFRAVGKKYAHRLESRRMRSAEVARRLDIEPIYLSVGTERKVLQPSYLASLVMTGIGRFCNSADPAPKPEHLPYIDGIDLPADGKRTYSNNDEVRSLLAPAFVKAWADLSDPDGQLRFSHDHYLTIWALGDPVIPGDFILVDECFPAGTQVETHLGPMPIEKIAATPDEGWRVLSSVDGGKTLNWSHVTTAYRTPRQGPLVRIDHEHGSLTCTANHPLWVEGVGWTPAGFVASGDTLRHLRQTDSEAGKGLFEVMRTEVGESGSSAGSGGGTKAQDRYRDATGSDRDTQSDGGPRRPSQDGGDTSPDWSRTESANGERDGTHHPGTDPVRGAGATLRSAALADRVCRAEWTRLPIQGDADLLQDRRGVSGVDGGGRGGWPVAQCPLPTGSGQAEGFDTFVSRVARVAVLESRSDGGPGRSGGEDYRDEVFTLSVSDGSYFAGGVLVKNCQDLNPRFASVVARQKAQVVYVGDSNQQLYEFRQAIDALASVSVERRAMLTISFRFGQGIADVANTILDQIPAARLRLTGQGPESTIGAAKDPDAILTRTNAGAIEAVLGAIEAGRRPHLVGGGAEIERFAKAAQDLMSDPPIPVEHPELAVFTSWGEVQTYVANDALGVELRLLVRLIDKYGVETVLKAVANSTPEASADVVISTVHKAKGREWGTVRLGSDFPYKADAEPNDAENRLCYVAATRAKRHLDFTVCAPIAALFADEVPPSSLADAPETARTSIPPAFVRVSGITSIMSGAKS